METTEAAKDRNDHKEIERETHKNSHVHADIHKGSSSITSGSIAKSELASTSYGEYLKLPELLSLQQPLSNVAGRAAHDELLFIVVHQAHELWFRQVLHELNSVMSVFSETPTVSESSVATSVSRLVRVNEIFKVLIDHLRILETMTPLDFLEFRDLLNPASGFQSVQFRTLEIKLGLLAPGRFCPGTAFASCLAITDSEDLRNLQQQPSLFQLVEKWLERTPFLNVEGYSFWQSYQRAVEDIIQRDRAATENHPLLSSEVIHQQLKEISKTELHFKALFDEPIHNQLVAEGQRRLSLKATHAALFIQLYRDQPVLHLPFKLLTSLIDLDELIQSWRSQHASMVHRMIGVKVGTGGSMGYPYLRSTVDKTKVFADFFNLSTFLIPRSSLPELPPELLQKLAFAYQVHS